MGKCAHVTWFYFFVVQNVPLVRLLMNVTLSVVLESLLGCAAEYLQALLHLLTSSYCTADADNNFMPCRRGCTGGLPLWATMSGKQGERGTWLSGWAVATPASP